MRCKLSPLRSWKEGFKSRVSLCVGACVVETSQMSYLRNRFPKRLNPAKTYRVWTCHEDTRQIQVSQVLEFVSPLCDSLFLPYACGTGDVDAAAMSTIWRTLDGSRRCSFRTLACTRPTRHIAATTTLGVCPSKSRVDRAAPRGPQSYAKVGLASRVCSAWGVDVSV